MSKRFGFLITVMLAFAVAPAVAFAGESSDDSAKKAERLAAKQAQVDSFVACLNGHGLGVQTIDVEAVLGERKLAHRGRGGFGKFHRGWRWFRGDSVNRVARFVVRAAELDRSDEAVRDAVQACRDEARAALAVERQGDVDALAACLDGKGHDVETIDLAERPRLASKRHYLGRAARVMLRTAEISLRDADVRADKRACVQEVKEAATA